MNSDQDRIANTILAGLNLISQAISIYDSNLRLVVANRRFQSMFDIPSQFVRPGASFRDTIQYLTERGEYGEIDEIPQYVEDRVAQARTFTPHYFERTRSNGTVISVEGSPLEQGGWVAVYTDITEIKRQQDVLDSLFESLSGELLRRQSARRGALETSNRVRFGGWSFDPDEHMLIAEDGATRKLSHREAQVLQVFLGAPNRLITRDYILDQVESRAGEHFDRAIDVRVSRLRSKLGDDPADPKIIKTIYGAGYIFIAKIDR